MERAESEMAMNQIQEQQSVRSDDEGVVARARDAGEAFGDALDGAVSSVGRGVDRAGKMIEGTGKSAGASVRSAGRYMQAADPATMRADFMATLGRHPGTTLAIGIGAGLLLGRIFQSYR